MSEPVGDFDQFLTAARYQLLGYLKTWRFFGLLIFVGIVSVVIFGVDLYRGADAVKTLSPTASSFLTDYLGFVNDAVIITAAFLGGDALAVDLAGGPGYLMLTQPVRRRTLLAGRYSAAALVGFAVASVYFAVAALSSYYFYQSVPWTIFVALGAAFLYGLASLAMAFAFSSLFRTPVVAIVASLLILLLAFPVLTAVGTLSGPEPWYSLDYAAEIIPNVFSATFVHESTMHVGGARGGGITVYTWTPYFVEGVAIMLVYLEFFLGLTYIIYESKEVKG